MIESHFEEKKIEENIIDKVFCDWCQNVINEDLHYQNYGEISIDFGFGSSFDTKRFIGEICDGCFKKHFEGKVREDIWTEINSSNNV